jgi:hypothetical protein
MTAEELMHNDRIADEFWLEYRALVQRTLQKVHGGEVREALHVRMLEGIGGGVEMGEDVEEVSDGDDGDSD